MMLVGLADSLDALHRVLRSHDAAERIAGVRWIDDDSMGPQGVHGHADVTLLRVARMEFEQLGHCFKSSAFPAAAGRRRVS